ncbi:Asp23/Gls24 family envelope stress response protein [Streptomyces reniochalinae]|uniref:Asp23/Gls24 family envelope stress response protein n=1 Tax=Streptomyces reniochalinae TaxID=2250578 RepID=UPI0015F0A660|nr:Asp23/Gls24 family envelope stress response protein [Streptomyces reniochalinae]
MEETEDEGVDERLPCGRLLSEVWEAEDQGTGDPHLYECPHCSAARAELGLLGDTVRDVLASEPDDRDGQGWDTTALTARVMDVVRLELRPGRPLPLGETSEDLWIMEAAAAKTVRAAAESLAGVHAGACRIGPPPEQFVPARPTEERRRPTHVELEVAVSDLAPLWEVADGVRERVRMAVDHELGMDVAAIDIRITDIYADEDDDEEIGMPGRPGHGRSGSGRAPAGGWEVTLDDR